jgi:uroporphyrinogen-III synthase
VHAVTFTSASTVRGFLNARGGEAIRGSSGVPPKVVCIGPVTASAARDAGLRPAAVAKPHTIEGLVAALERALPF